MGCVKLNFKPPLLFIYLMGCVKLNFKPPLLLYI